MVFKLAWRNLWRRKRRSLITCSSIAFGFWLAVIVSGISNYSYTSMINNSASTGFGHVTVLHNQYLDNPSLKKYVEGIDSHLIKLKSDPRIAHASPRVSGQGMAATAKGAQAVQFVAIDPEVEKGADNLFVRKLVEGRLFAKSDAAQCVLGKKLASKLGVTIGKKLVYTTTDAKGEVTSQMVRVAGIFSTGADEIDNYMMLLPIDNVRKAVGYSAAQGTMIAVQLHDQRDSSEVRDDLRDSLGLHSNDQVYFWRETQPDVAGFVDMDEGSSRIFLIFIIILVGLGVLNTLLMSVMERKREFGIMLAIGMSPGRLIRGIMLESILIGLSGVALGAVLTIPSHLYFAHVGLDFSSMIQEGMTAAGSVFDTTLRSTIYAINIIVTGGGLILMAMAVAAYPAWKAGRTPPVESIRNL